MGGARTAGISLITAVAAGGVLVAPRGARADMICHVVDFSLQPAQSDLQIVAWIAEPSTDPAKPGKYLGTAYITQQTGRFGLGNRPGRFDFNSGPTPPNKDVWPYGRRVTTFPVWSHANNYQIGKLIFQNGRDDDLSHPFNHSSPEQRYCRPQLPGEPAWDAGTCASQAYTDKGLFSTTEMTGYPPRVDVARVPGSDSMSVDLFKWVNPFDAVSQATPLAGTQTNVSWRAPAGTPAGNYVLWVEVSRAFDYNATYNEITYPGPSTIAFKDYGRPYRGQPAVLYKVPFTIGTADTAASTLDYVGYAHPDGSDGNIRPPDATITTDTPGTGASRLQILSGSPMARVRIATHPEFDVAPPGEASVVEAVATSSSSAIVEFVAPGDDGTVGKVAKYEIRYLVDAPITDENFDTGSGITTTVVPETPGTQQQFEITGLLPETDYYIGIRAIDDCDNRSPVVVAKVRTLDRPVGEVNSCFVATAAYGTALANEIEPLRRFRDVMLRQSALGELAVETYYTFGPAVAGVVGESDLLRAFARDVLAPIIARVRGLSF